MAVRGSVSAARTLAAALSLSVSLLALGAGLPGHNALAQDLLPAGLETPSVEEPQMLLEAAEVTYDFDRDIILATGNVQVYYSGYTVEARQIVFNRATQTLTARGDVLMTEPDGNVVQSQEIILSEDLAEGFARALQVDTPDRTRFIAEKASRTEGNVSTFENGIYTVYTSDKNPPNKPPLWRIRAAKIIHDQKEKVIYYEDAAFEFFGTPIAYVPYFSMPDPSVKRKSGFLIPGWVIADRLGVGATIPYYWALSPHYDVTTTVSPLSRQGALLDVNFRHRLISGSYTIAAAGIFQSDPSAFRRSSGDERYRGAIQTTGAFDLSTNWSYGWNLLYKSDRSFFSDYSFTSFSGDQSNIYLEGHTDRNALTFHAYAFSISQEDYTTDGINDPSAAFSPVGSSLQDKQPFVMPVVDYDYVFDDPVVGGELSFTGNFTSLTRAETDAFQATGSNVDRFRGVDGTFSRLSLQGDWRKTFIDPLGQVFTPFAYVRGDLFFLASADKNVRPLADESFVGRAMPAVGMEYRFPFVATFDGGNQILEPVAQVIVRPDEQSIGELPNEDAQSIVFDSTTLFAYDKFSGFDRAEGGSRVNLGVNYKLQLDEGYFLSAMFGQSFHVAGKNSFETPDILGATQNSGLATGRSDYVGSLYLDTQYGVRIGAQARLDDDDLRVRRFQAQATGTYGPVVSSIAYAFLGEQPDLGINDPREEFVGSASLRLKENWRVFGSARYDLENSNLVQNGLGLGYDDEGFSMSLTFAEDRSRNNGEPVNQTIFLRLGLRTLGSSQFQTGAAGF